MLDPERPPGRGDACAHRRAARGCCECDTWRDRAASMAGAGGKDDWGGLHKPRLLRHVVQKWNGSPMIVAPPTRLFSTHPTANPRGLSRLILPRHTSLRGHRPQMPSRTLSLHMLFPLLTMPCLDFFFSSWSVPIQPLRPSAKDISSRKPSLSPLPRLSVVALSSALSTCVPISPCRIVVYFFTILLAGVAPFPWRLHHRTLSGLCH